LTSIKQAFQQVIVPIPIEQIIPQREVTNDQTKGVFYKQILASLDEIGLIEPLVVYPRKPGEYLLLDGHMRLTALKATGKTDVLCILAYDDEGYTYNRRVNSIPPVAQHLMLLKAIENGLTEERIARSLHVDISSIRRKRDLLNGICEEAVELLHTRKVSARVFYILKKMKPLRQVEAVEHMIASSIYSATFVKALLYTTKAELLVDRAKARSNSILPEITKHLFSQESETLLRDLKGLEAELGREALTLTVFQAYVTRLLKNARVLRYLERKHPEILGVLQTRTMGAQ
jgi:ParB-like chromosome segregation protein Spo0J